MNECDNCNKALSTESLVWLTADDFTPLKGEVVPSWAYRCYDTLCDDCYTQLIRGELVAPVGA